ncbi:FHA domain-containing protein [Herbiconiux sp. 11R-BC]|uniref:FHA domain-containing protein n=1 Tax=Herbiconiux sp. 11R-BC TaxID=3111637 RepID=UPI003C110213
MKCRTCGTILSPGALLCGECGTSAIAPRPTLGDTARYDRQALLDAIAGEERRSRGGALVAPAVPGPDATPRSEPETPLPTAAAPETAGLVTEAAAAVPAPAAPATAAPAASRASGSLFSLVFSTGESIRVAGSGLVGRNPAPAAGERVDYLVQIVDPERSVSKTHLEFGVDDGGLWVADRGSSNGTRLEPDRAEPLELRAGERMRVERGTRVGIGDQYFDVH